MGILRRNPVGCAAPLCPKSGPRTEISMVVEFQLLAVKYVIETQSLRFPHSLLTSPQDFNMTSIPLLVLSHSDLCSNHCPNILMIIKGLFRRYERWNPVHPTIGTFWGMGIGIGCGIGWGPGFGPEVVGYVGAGCGVGFSVGITLAGIGVGLPQNGLFQILYNTVTTNSGPLEYVRSFTLTTMKDVTEDGLNYAAPHISFLRKETRRRLSRIKSDFYVRRDGLNKLNTAMSKRIQSSLECIEAFKDNIWPPEKGA
ncbi:cadmium-induced protein AS8 [Canna indica]|uniref:Cadmium-induced protein AS8 n=1 Tax=Canna indica TaxID=4628 RepID=A0AAQ3KYG3_9LILI|nr:cadmium-induced protein AS8 [Canna indica]